MKQIKHKGTLLSFFMIAAIFIAMLMMIMDMCVSGESWFMYEEGGVLVMDWHYAGIYLAFMVIALLTWMCRFFKYSLPKIRENQCRTCMTLEILILLGIVLAIIALLIPMGLETGAFGGEDIYSQPRMMAGVVMAWIGLPLAFMASIFKSTLALTAK